MHVFGGLAALCGGAGEPLVSFLWTHRVRDNLAAAAEGSWAGLTPLAVAALVHVALTLATLVLAAGRVRLRRLVSLQQIVDALFEGALAVQI